MIRNRAEAPKKKKKLKVEPMSNLVEHLALFFFFAFRRTQVPNPATSITIQTKLFTIFSVPYKTPELFLN